MGQGGWFFSFLAAFARPAQGPRFDIPLPATVTGSLPCIECSTDKVLRVLPHGKWNRSCIANTSTRSCTVLSPGRLVTVLYTCCSNMFRCISVNLDIFVEARRN